MDLLMMFDVMMLCLGVYMTVAAFVMKKSGRIRAVILTEQEIAVCRDKNGFIAYMYWREAVAVGVLILAGASGFINDLFFHARPWDMVKMASALAAFLWFWCGMSAARERFLKK